MDDPSVHLDAAGAGALRRDGGVGGNPAGRGDDASGCSALLEATRWGRGLRKSGIKSRNLNVGGGVDGETRQEKRFGTRSAIFRLAVLDSDGLDTAACYKTADG